MVIGRTGDLCHGKGICQEYAFQLSGSSKFQRLSSPSFVSHVSFFPFFSLMTSGYEQCNTETTELSTGKNPPLETLWTPILGRHDSSVPLLPADFTSKFQVKARTDLSPAPLIVSSCTLNPRHLSKCPLQSVSNLFLTANCSFTCWNLLLWEREREINNIHCATGLSNRLDRAQID